MQAVVGVAIGVLAVVLLFSGIAVTVVVKKKCCNSRRKDEEEQNNSAAVENQQSERHLIDEELTDDPITIQHVLDDEVWVEDAAGAMSHCIPILKGCHELTSRLLPITVQRCETAEQNKEVQDMACKVVPRIDSVVQLLEGPMDPRLVEARCTALYYAVSNLVLTIRSISSEESLEDWVHICLKDIETHLQVLQEKSHNPRSRSLSGGSVRGREELSSPAESSCSSSASTTKSNSRASTSNTDSGESGIDVHMPLDRNGSSDSTNSQPKSSHIKSAADNHIDVEIDGQVSLPLGGGNKQYAVAEVHREMDAEEERIELEEMSYANRGFENQECVVTVS